MNVFFAASAAVLLLLAYYVGSHSALQTWPVYSGRRLELTTVKYGQQHGLTPHAASKFYNRTNKVSLQSAIFDELVSNLTQAQAMNNELRAQIAELQSSAQTHVNDNSQTVDYLGPDHSSTTG